jgi:uncharacterized tellurite resistance protein B-like protein
MIDLVKRFFSRSQEPSSQDKTGGDSHDIRVAACAILLEMADIDEEFDASERERILAILKQRYRLSDVYARALLQSAREELEGSIDLWRFTHLINQHYSLEEKLLIIEMVWNIAYEDGRLDKHEDYLAHKLADLLHIDHKRLMEAKLKVNKKKRTSPGP